jgi:hypothetical protein
MIKSEFASAGFSTGFVCDRFHSRLGLMLIWLFFWLLQRLGSPQLYVETILDEPIYSAMFLIRLGVTGAVSRAIVEAHLTAGLAIYAAKTSVSSASQLSLSIRIRPRPRWCHPQSRMCCLLRPCQCTIQFLEAY